MRAAPPWQASWVLADSLSSFSGSRPHEQGCPDGRAKLSFHRSRSHLHLLLWGLQGGRWQVSLGTLVTHSQIWGTGQGELRRVSGAGRQGPGAECRGVV